MNTGATTNINKASNACSAGLWLSATRARVVLISSVNEIVARHEIALSAPDSIEAVTRDCVELVRAAQSSGSEAGSLPELNCIGIAIPGLVKTQTQSVVMSTELPTLAEHDLAAQIRRATGLPVHLENDANAAAFAEYKLGAGQGARNLFFVTIGYGVGGALILGGELWRGVSGLAGEFGYFVIDIEGTTLESVASAPNIVKRTKNRLLQDSTSSLSKLATLKSYTAADISRAAREGDDFSAMMVERTGRYVGMAIASVINLLNIERIVFGGGFAAEAGDLLLAPITREVKRRSFRTSFEATQISLAQLGADATTLGAAMLARDKQDTRLQQNR